MAYAFVTKEKHPEKETLYVLYMMVGSCFGRSECRTPQIEQQLFLYYKEMAVDKQTRLETKVLREIEKNLKSYLPLFEEMHASAHFELQGETNGIWFETGFETVRATVDSDGGFKLEVLEAA